MDLGDALEALLPLNVTASECVGDAWLKQHDTMLVKEHQVGSHTHETLSRDTTHGTGKLSAGHYLSLGPIFGHVWRHVGHSPPMEIRAMSCVPDNEAHIRRARNCQKARVGITESHTG